MLHVHRHLIGLRRRQPWLHRGRIEVGELSNEQIAYTVSDPDGPGRVLVELDAATGSARVSSGDEVHFSHGG